MTDTPVQYGTDNRVDTDREIRIRFENAQRPTPPPADAVRDAAITVLRHITGARRLTLTHDRDRSTWQATLDGDNLGHPQVQHLCGQPAQTERDAVVALLKQVCRW